MEIRANTASFERELKSKVQGTATKSPVKVPVELDTKASRNPIKQFTAGVEGLEGRLGKLGLTTRDLSVVMGAGLAGGVAFAAREMVQFTQASIEAASALREQEAASEAVFGSSQELVEGFAEQAAAIGLSERAALAATTTFGGFFQNIGLAEAASAKLAVGFTALAADTASLFDIDTETAQQRLISGLRGEQDAVERLNVSINEKAVADRAMTDSGKESVEQLTQGERVMARAKIIAEQLTVAYGNFAMTADDLANTQRRATAEWENAKAALGDALQPAAVAVTNAFTDQVNALRALDDGYQKTNDSVTLFGIGFRQVIDGKDTNAFQKLKDIVFGFGGDAEDAADTADELAGALDELEDPTNQAAVAAGELADATDDAAKAQKRLTRAVADSERAVDNAERRLSRAVVDSAERIEDAQRNVSEAYEDRSERIADAERGLAEQQLDSVRSIRDARERLSDFDDDAASREAENQRTLARARKDRTKAILNATVALSSARRAEDAEAINAARLALREAQDNTNVNDAERELAEGRKERKQERQRLERELSEAIVEAQKQEEDARRNLAQTIEDTNERIEDSERNLAEARRDGARQVEDAQRALNDAIREGAEKVADAKDALDEYAIKAGEAAVQTKRLKNEMKDLHEIAKDLANDFFDPGLQDAFAEVMGRQHGGPVQAGRPYLVGEAGPELMVPGRAGSVVTNDQLMAALSKMVAVNRTATAGPTVGQMNVMVPHQDPRVLANELSFLLARGVRS